jgi:hypothetical protein
VKKVSRRLRQFVTQRKIAGVSIQYEDVARKFFAKPLVLRIAMGAPLAYQPEGDGRVSRRVLNATYAGSLRRLSAWRET